MSAPSALEIHLLAGFRVFRDGKLIEDGAWTRNKARAMVKILALERGHQLHRDHLLEMLWPGADPGLAQNNFHKSLHAARRALEPELTDGSASQFLVLQEQRLQIRGYPLRIDADEFEEAARRSLRSGPVAEVEAAALLYRGELLPEDRYEDWAAPRRERLEVLSQDLLLVLGEQADPETAVASLEKLIGRNPTLEAGHRLLMGRYAAAGRRDLAIGQYRQCEESLRRELDAAPESSTRELFEEILAGTFRPAAGARLAEPSLLVEPSPSAIPADLAPADQAPVTPPAQSAPPEAPRWRRLRWVAAALICALAVIAAFRPWDGQFRPGRSAIRSIAVLPIVSPDPGGVVLAEGITEELIRRLSALPGIRVIARSTVFALAGVQDPRVAGGRLGVDAVVAGRLESASARSRMHLELVDCADGARLWATALVLRSDDPLGAQIQVAAALADALQVPMNGPAEWEPGGGEGGNACSRPAAFSLLETELREAVESLGAPAATLIYAAFYEGWSHSEVAERTGVPLGTVKTRVRMALIRLRKRLRGWEPVTQPRAFPRALVPAGSEANGRPWESAS